MKIIIRALRLSGEDNEILFIAEVNSRVVGSVYLGNLERRAAYIRQLQVRRRYRNKGIGSKLIKMCRKIATKSKCESLGLDVLKDNQGVIEFYRKNEFFLAYEYDDGAVLMSINLTNK